MKLYIDCDGVLLNTIEVLYRVFDIFHEHEPTITMTDWLKIIDWSKVLHEAGALNDSVEVVKTFPIDKYNISTKTQHGERKVKYVFKPIDGLAILTTVQSSEEAFQKIKYIRELGVEHEIIIVPARCDKNEVVSAKGNILVDDHKENLRKWQDAGGIAIQFHQEKKKGEFQIINSLSQIHWLDQ